jgi:hypothetical protein
MFGRIRNISLPCKLGPASRDRIYQDCFEAGLRGTHKWQENQVHHHESNQRESEPSQNYSIKRERKITKAESGAILQREEGIDEYLPRSLSLN